MHHTTVTKKSATATQDRFSKACNQEAAAPRLACRRCTCNAIEAFNALSDPLTVIKGYLQLLDKHAFPPEQSWTRQMLGEVSQIETILKKQLLSANYQK